MHRSIRVAFCGIITAFSTVLMFLTGLIPIATYALPALSGILLTIVVIEVGASWAWSVYIATSAFSLLIAGDKEAAVLFVLFFGYYPILKATIEKIHNKYLSYFLKFIVFNVSMILVFFLTINLLGVPKDSFTVLGVYLPWVFLVVGNFIFALYDYAISTLIVMYYRRYHKLVSKWFR